MKPECQFDKRRFPETDCFFQSGYGRWRGGWSDDDGESRRRRNLGREYLVEAARERTKEMLVLGVLLLAAVWPVISVMIEITRFYKTHQR